MYQEYLNQMQTSIAPLSSDELKDLLNDDEKLDDKVSEVLETLKAQKDNLLVENRSKAENNIEKEPKIIESRGKVNDLLEEAKQFCQAVQDKLGEVKDKSGNVSQETALALIQTAAAESEEATDTLIKQFTDNEIGVEAFLDDFLATRKTMHLRKLKAEKMQELIRRQSQAAQRGNIGGAMPAYGNLLPNSGFYPTPGVPGMGVPGMGVPYPLGPMMPMPPPRPY